MSEISWATLRQRLIERYDEFRGRLARRLGSDDLASESLHEAYLRLDREDALGPVRNVDAYVMRTAINIAVDARRSENRRLTRSEVLDELELSDDAPDPAREAEGRIAIAHLGRLILELPWRQRAILIAARLHGTPHQDLARRYGISKRMVQLELRAALDYCEERLEKYL